MDAQSRSGSAAPVRVGLALGAGGIKGWAHVGVVKVLHEAGIPIHAVSGASAGALIGPLYAASLDPEKMERVALSFSVDEFAEWFARGLRLTEDGGRMSRRLWKAYGRYDFDELPVPFAAAALDLGTRSRLIIREGRVGAAVEASIRPPFFGPPARLNGCYLLDGGFQTAVPTDIAREMGADVVIASNVGAFMGLPERLRPYSGMLAERLLDGCRRVDGFRGQIGFMADFLSRERVKWPVADVEIKVNMRGVSAFSPWHCRLAIKRGENAARRALPATRQALEDATRSTGEAAPPPPDPAS